MPKGRIRVAQQKPNLVKSDWEVGKRGLWFATMFVDGKSMKYGSVEPHFLIRTIYKKRMNSDPANKLHYRLR